MVATLNSGFANFIFGLSSPRDFGRDKCQSIGFNSRLNRSLYLSCMSIGFGYFK